MNLGHIAFQAKDLDSLDILFANYQILLKSVTQKATLSWKLYW